MKKIIKLIIITLSFISIVSIISCSNTVDSKSSIEEKSTDITIVTDSNVEQGTATVRFFVPDYYALSKKTAERVIAPQTVSAKLSYNMPNLGWIGVSTIKLADAEKTSVENAAEGFSGLVYTMSFNGVPVGIYEAGELLISLLDSSGQTVTSGTSTTKVTITKGGKDSTVFYALPDPAMSSTKFGNLAAGEMKFSYEYLYADLEYKITMKSTGDYPDMVLFDSQGKLVDYYIIDSADDKVSIKVESSGNYYVGVWADDGSSIGRYEYSFGKLEFIEKTLYAGISYDIEITSDGDYPSFGLFTRDTGKLIHYYKIEQESDAHIKLTVENTNIYTFAISGSDTAKYTFIVDEIKGCSAFLVEGIEYKVKIESSKDYPDLAVLYNADGNCPAEWYGGSVVDYYEVEDKDDCNITLKVNRTGEYQLFLVGSNPDAYKLIIDELKTYSVNLVAGLDYKIKIEATNEYPDFVILDASGCEMAAYIVGKLIETKKIKEASDCNITLNVEKTGPYHLCLVGSNPESYKLTFDVSNGTEVYGTIPDDKLHWTVENSPYIVTDNLWLREDKVLKIDAGVIVQFTGNYYIKVNGVIEAQGTKEKPIMFICSGDYYGNWDGIFVDSSSGLSLSSSYTYSSGSILQHCQFINANAPLRLNTSVYVDSCLFTNNGQYVKVENNNSLLINNVFDNGLYIYSGNPNVVNNYIKSQFTIYSDYASIKNNTFENANIYFGWGNYIVSSNMFNACYINNISSMDTAARITGNNFTGFSGTIINVSNSSYSDRKIYNFTSNYWGKEQTLELNQKGDNTDISFFNDIYDNFNYTEIDYSGWATEPIENCGYSETGFVAFDFTVNGYDFNGGYYPESKNTSLIIKIIQQYCVSSIADVRIAQSYEELKNTEWIAFEQNLIYNVDKTKCINDEAMVYMQVRDSDGNESAAVVHNIPFDTPKPKLSVKDGTIYDNAIKKKSIEYSATDLCNIVAYSLSLDGSKVVSDSGSSWGTTFSSSYELALSYIASGTHTLTMTATDSAGNIGETKVLFTINRNFDESSVKDISYNSTTGQFYKDANTLHLWHLDNDGKEDSGTAEITMYVHTNGGFEGAASSLNGSVPLDISTNAFTVEFWTRGRGTMEIGKNESIRIYNRFDYSTSYDGWMYHYYETTDGITNTWIYSSSATRARADDQWHYWAYVYDGTYTAIYCDGVCVAYQDGFTHTLNTNNNNLSISASGIIDEIRISNNARTADGISSYYKTAKPILDANTVSVNVIVW